VSEYWTYAGYRDTDREVFVVQRQPLDGIGGLESTFLIDADCLREHPWREDDAFLEECRRIGVMDQEVGS
jgi:hypothetical protein